jgi:hypothetical protein
MFFASAAGFVTVTGARDSVHGFKNLLSNLAIAARQHRRRLARLRRFNGLSELAHSVFLEAEGELNRP